MLKMAKVSMSVAVALLGAVVSTQSFADDAHMLQNKDFVNASSYAVGVSMGNIVKNLASEQKDLITFNQSLILSGVKDALDGKVKISDEELQKQLEQLDTALKAKQESVADQAASKFRQEYLAQHPKAKELPSGLIYLIEKEGSGEKVTADDTVTVNYEGKLINGTVFDSSYKRGEPVTFQLKQLIPGWVEGIPLIKKGGEVTLVIPPKLGYGAQAAGSIPANSTLIFKIELLDVKPASK